MGAARHAWLAAHPYLAPIARLQGIVEEAAARGAANAPPAWRWDSLAEDAEAGVPILRGAAAGPALAAWAGDELRALVDRLAGAPLPGGVAAACRDLLGALPSPTDWARAMSWVLEGAPAESAPVHPGLLTLLGWTVARRVLAPVIGARAASFARREEHPWDHGHCPTCGSLPVMAQLVPHDASQARFLVCGCCTTAWRFRRIGCPFCGNEAPERLGILEIAGEARLRIDACSECDGYVKTYVGAGDEDVFLADWPTLHLDLRAQERGLRRLGASLYELPRDERGVHP